MWTVFNQSVEQSYLHISAPMFVPDAYPPLKSMANRTNEALAMYTHEGMQAARKPGVSRA